MAWDEFSKACPIDAARLFFFDERRDIFPRHQGGGASNVTDKEVTFEPAPCSKLRIVLRLASPWLAACRSEMRRVIVDHSWQQRASGAFAGFRTDRSGCWIGDAACFRTARASGGS